MHEIVSQHAFVCFHFQYIHHLTFHLCVCVFFFSVHSAAAYFVIHTFILYEWLLSQQIAVICFRILCFRVCVRTFFFFPFFQFTHMIVTSLLLSLKSFSLLRFLSFLVRLHFPFSFGGYGSYRPHHHYHYTVCTLNNQQAYMRCVMVCVCVPQTKICLYSDDDEVEIPRKNESDFFLLLYSLTITKIETKQWTAQRLLRCVHNLFRIQLNNIWTEEKKTSTKCLVLFSAYDSLKYAYSMLYFTP